MLKDRDFTPVDDFDGSFKNEERKKALAPKVIEIAKKHLKGKHFKLFFFGSRVNGKPSARSDFDIGIESFEEIRAEAYLNIQDEIGRLPVMQEVQFVDFRKVDDEFRKIALKKTEVFYEQ